MAPFLYLASQSPRRSQLLAQLGISHELLLPDQEEDTEALEAVRPGEAPRAYVQRITRLKLQAAVARRLRRNLPAAPILCADTTVARGRTIFGKPVDEADAVRILTALSGQTHRVLTAVALSDGERLVHAVSDSRVTFAALSTEAIETYVASGEPLGKAGAYAVQGLAAAYIASIRGSYTGIMGLPLFETAQLIQQLSQGPCSKTS